MERLPFSEDACYHALVSRDARFDGTFFTGVSSTGIYCRPVCRVRTPKRTNCHFFALAAQAEQAGYRPCLRCRPELAPLAQAWSVQDGSASLAAQAAHLLDSWAAQPGFGMTTLAQRLGVSDRHLRRLFEQHWGITPLQYLQTRRLLKAKQWLTDTRWPITRVAESSGFASLRRFNDAFVRHYGLSPSRWRRAGTEPANHTRLRLCWREPYDADALLAFLAQRQISGVELVDTNAYSVRRTLSLAGPAGQPMVRGWITLTLMPARHQVNITCSPSLEPQLPVVLARVRHWLDLDADPMAIDAVLGPRFPGTAGLRVPGGPDGFELAIRIILGQQVSVAAARTLSTRLAVNLGCTLATPWADLTHTFPDATVLATTPPEVLGALGLTRQRQSAVIALARAVVNRDLDLAPEAPLAPTLATLQSLDEIGPWTAQMIALRVLRWPDAFPAGDLVLQQALRLDSQQLSASARARLAEQKAECWRPWRGYAMLRAWATSTTQSPS